MRTLFNAVSRSTVVRCRYVVSETRETAAPKASDAIKIANTDRMRRRLINVFSPISVTPAVLLQLLTVFGGCVAFPNPGFVGSPCYGTNNGKRIPLLRTADP